MSEIINQDHYKDSVINYIKILLSQTELLESKINSSQKYLGSNKDFEEVKEFIHGIDNELLLLREKILSIDEKNISKVLLESNIIKVLNELNEAVNNQLDTKISRLIQNSLSN